MITVAVVIFPLINTPSTISGYTKEFIQSVGIFVAIFATMGSLYGWKIVLLVQGYDYDVLLQLSKKVSKESTVSVSTRKRSQTYSVSQVPGMPSQVTAERRYSVTINPFEAVKTKSLLKRREVCRGQVTQWSKNLRHTEAMMLMQAHTDTTIDDTQGSQFISEIEKRKNARVRII